MQYWLYINSRAGWYTDISQHRDDEIWLLTIYSKNEVENIPAHVLRQTANEVENV